MVRDFKMGIAYGVLCTFFISPVGGMDLEEKAYNAQKAALQHTLNAFSKTPNCAAAKDARTKLENLERNRERSKTPVKATSTEPASTEIKYITNDPSSSSASSATSSPASMRLKLPVKKDSLDDLTEEEVKFITQDLTPPSSSSTTASSLSLAYSSSDASFSEPEKTITSSPKVVRKSLGENFAGLKYFDKATDIPEEMLKKPFGTEYIFYFGSYNSFNTEEEQVIATRTIETLGAGERWEKDSNFKKELTKYAKLYTEHQFYKNVQIRAHNTPGTEDHLKGLEAYIKKKDHELNELLNKLEKFVRPEKQGASSSSHSFKKDFPVPEKEFNSAKSGPDRSADSEEEGLRVATYLQHAENIENVSLKFSFVKQATVDAHAVSANIKSTYKDILAASKTFFGDPPPATPAYVKAFFTDNEAKLKSLTFMSLAEKDNAKDKTPLPLEIVQERFLKGWKEHTGKTSLESGLNVDQIRATTLHAMQQFIERIGYSSDDVETCLLKLMMQASDATGTCLEGHTNRHFLTLLGILQAYVQHMKPYL